MLTQAADPELLNAIQNEAYERVKYLLQGVANYQTQEYTRIASQADVVWQEGAAKLLDYGAPEEKSDAPVLLFVPSLINRSYIFDLSPDNSIVSMMRAHGHRCFVMDWGAPSETEENFSCQDYITRYLFAAVDKIRALTSLPIVTIGYCMGGLLTLALAQLRQKDIKAMALLVTPWDFFTPNFPRIPLEDDQLARVEAILNKDKIVAPEIIQTLFYLVNPWVFHSKFRQFATLPKQSEEVQRFMALEGWVNDGVPMTSEVARECLIRWTQFNAPAKGEWKIADTIIDPEKIHLPAFVAVPRNDRIVPRESAIPLTELLPNSFLIEPSSGHVGMVVGDRAARELWQPLLRWIATL